ncbi:MAG: glycosyltransferase family protein [Candidatus Acidulodesulfobacterium sp.]
MNNNITFEIIKTKISDAPSFKINGITVHSAYDPLSEAKKWAAQVADRINSEGMPDKIIIFGLGAGYHVKALTDFLKKDGKEIKIEVIEPAKASIEFIKDNFDVSGLLSAVNITALDIVSENQHLDASAISKKLELDKGSILFCELPSYKKIFSESYDLIRKLHGINQFFTPSSFKVLVVQPMYGGSSTIGNYLYSALLNLGYDAKILDFSKFYDAYKYIGEFTPNEDHVNSLKQGLFNLMSEALLSSVFNEPPDLVVFMAQSPASERTLLKLRSMGIKTAYWFVEDFRTLTYWNTIAKNVDYFFTIQKDDFFAELKNIGADNYHYLPLACLPNFHKKITEINEEDEIKYGSDVSFAGAGYYNRKNVFAQLVDFNFKIWGADWYVGLPLSLLIQDEGRRFTEEEAVKIYNYSKININLHSSMWHWDINPNGDFLNPRVYEILACGGFQLVDRRKYMDGVFEDGKDFVVFESVDDLRKKIKYYLANEDERLAIAEHGRKTVVKNHTYEQRVLEMMNIILLSSYEQIKSKFETRKQNISELLKETEGNKELHDLIMQFSDKKSLSIKDMVEHIKSGKGRLSKSEALILMLWAIKSKLVKLEGL